MGPVVKQSEWTPVLKQCGQTIVKSFISDSCVGHSAEGWPREYDGDDPQAKATEPFNPIETTG
jgi:hypothetical protein